MGRAGFVALMIGCAMGCLLAVAGCGGSNSSSSSEQLEAARRQGEEAAREKDRINSLQHKVNHLQHQVHHQSHTVVVEHGSATTTVTPQDSGSTVLRTFHAPSGNVSCEILSSGALCSVDSIGETFVFSDGEAAHTESGAALPRDSGDLAPYGSTVSAGSIICTIPQSSEPRGITCSDSESGHGFEASRISDRQSVY